MASETQVREFSAANSRLRRSAAAEVRALVAGLRLIEDYEQVRDLLLEVMPTLVGDTGDMAAEVAAEFYESARAAAGAAARPLNLPSRPTVEQVRASTRWSLGPLFERGDWMASTARLAQVTDRLAIEMGDTLVQTNARRSGARWAWVPNGQCCAWCTLKASRGPVYTTQSAAEAGRHADCDCTSVPIWTPDDLPGHYDPADYYDDYMAGRQAADGHDVRSILAGMRKANATA